MQIIDKIMEVIRSSDASSLCLDREDDVNTLESLLVERLRSDNDGDRGVERRVSVTFALREICDAVHACRLLASTMEADGFDNELERRDAHAALAAMLSIVNLYAENWATVLAGDADPRSVWTPRNAASNMFIEGDEKDLVLEARHHQQRQPRRAESAVTSASIPLKGASSKTTRRKKPRRV